MENNNPLYIYIDESGSMGLNGKEPYFIICALLLHQNQMKAIKNVVKRTFQQIYENMENKELHANEMTFKEKTVFFNYLNNTDFKICYLSINKDKVNNIFFRKKHLYFNYMIYLTLENVMKNCIDKEIYIIVDNRNIKITAEDSLNDYLNIELIKNKLYDKNIHLKYSDSKENRYLQVVDLLANAIYANYNFNKTYFYKYIINNIIDIVYHPDKFDIKNKLD